MTDAEASTNDREDDTSWLLALIACVFAIVGSLLTVTCACNLILQTVTILRAQPVDAVVVSSSLEHLVAFRSRGGSSSTYAPRIVFQYTVNGVDHESTRVRPGWFSWSVDNRSAKAFIRTYSPGAIVTAYYDPRAPQRGFLQTGFDWVTFFVLLLGLASLTASWLAWRQHTKGPKLKFTTLRSGMFFRP